MNPGFAVLLISLGLILMALPWVFGVPRTAVPVAQHRTIPQS